MGSEDLTFAEKLKTLHFGTVPGGYRDQNSTTMYDRDALLDQIGDSHGSIFSKERVEDARSDVRRRTKEFLSE